MALLIQSWFVLTLGLLAVFAVVVGVQGLTRRVRRALQAADNEVARPSLRLVRS